MQKSAGQKLYSGVAKSLVLFAFMAASMPAATSAQSTWKILPNAPALNSGRYEDIFFVNEKIGWAVTGGTIIKTSNGGETWETQLNDDSVRFLRSITFLDSLRGWAGTLDGELLQTNDGGEHWGHVDTLITPHPYGVCDLSAVGDSVVVGAGRWSGPTNLVTSTNSGKSWTNKSMDNYAALLIGCKFLTPKIGFIVGGSKNDREGGIVLQTSNGGATWEYRHKTLRRQEHVWNITFVTPQVGYATLQNPFRLDTLAIIKTSNGGLTWRRKTIGPSSTVFRYTESIGFVTEKKGWVASGAGNGMYETRDGGETWTYLDFGARIHGMHIVNDSVGYACGTTIYKYSPEISTRVDEDILAPRWPRLHQNYPNPFNVSTTISYTLPKRTYAWLAIYNLEGRLVATPQRGYQDAGGYRIKWEATNLPSGIYLYSLRTDEGMLVGKAVLVK